MMEYRGATGNDVNNARSSRPYEQFPSRIKSYQSEYKKNFLPFSQYEYIDGRFFKRRSGNQDSESPWYKEVIELRQKAGEYKFRGWGSEVGTTIVVPAFNHQLWKQVSHKSSFNALALITTTSRALAKKEKSKENVPTPSSTLKGAAGIRRPHTATPKHPIVSDHDSSKTKDDDIKVLSKSKPPQLHQVKQTSRTSQNKVRSQSAEPGLRNKRNLPSKVCSIGGNSSATVGERENVMPASSILKSKDSVTTAEQADTASTLHSKNRRPTTLYTSPHSRSTASSSGSRDQSKSVIRQHFNKGSVDRFDRLDGTTDEIIVKTPPEPTRVKSPEQVKLKSPDPVNWMVPLDTTKGFTVTQHIPTRPAVGGA